MSAIIVGPMEYAALPDFSLDGKAVLDVGCNTGKDLLHPAFSRAKRLGVDISAEAIDYGRKHYPGLTLEQAPAERLPFDERSFDFVVCRVALPYTDIPKALHEMARVMKPGASLLLTLHDWRHQWQFAKRAGFKGLVRFAVVLMSSSVYALTGRAVGNLIGARETFQTHGRITKDLRAAGFRNIAHERTEQHWIVRAVRE